MWISRLKGLKIMENYKAVRPNIGRGRLRVVLIIWLVWLGKILVIWIGGRLREIVACGSSTVCADMELSFLHDNTLLL